VEVWSAASGRTKACNTTPRDIHGWSSSVMCVPEMPTACAPVVGAGGGGSDVPVDVEPQAARRAKNRTVGAAKRIVRMVAGPWERDLE